MSTNGNRNDLREDIRHLTELIIAQGERIDALTREVASLNKNVRYYHDEVIEVRESRVGP